RPAVRRRRAAALLVDPAHPSRPRRRARHGVDGRGGHRPRAPRADLSILLHPLARRHEDLRGDRGTVPLRHGLGEARPDVRPPRGRRCTMNILDILITIIVVTILVTIVLGVITYV